MEVRRAQTPMVAWIGTKDSCQALHLAVQRGTAQALLLIPCEAQWLCADWLDTGIACTERHATIILVKGNKLKCEA